MSDSETTRWSDFPEHPRVPPTADRAAAVFDAFQQVMGRAADNNDIARRLALAGIVAHIHLRDAPQQFVLALFLDRAPIEVETGPVGTPDVELFIDTEDVLRFWTGDMHLAMAILRGEVEYRGPVRKLLRVVPIARRLVSDFQAPAADTGLTSQHDSAEPRHT